MEILLCHKMFVLISFNNSLRYLKNHAGCISMSVSQNVCFNQFQQLSQKHLKFHDGCICMSVWQNIKINSFHCRSNHTRNMKTFQTSLQRLQYKLQDKSYFIVTITLNRTFMFMSRLVIIMVHKQFNRRISLLLLLHHWALHKKKPHRFIFCFKIWKGPKFYKSLQKSKFCSIVEFLPKIAFWIFLAYKVQL